MDNFENIDSDMIFDVLQNVSILKNNLSKVGVKNNEKFQINN